VANLLDTRIVRDWLTGLDGETWALGRGLGVLITLVCLVLAIAVTVTVAITQRPTAPDWGAFLVGLGGFIVTTSTAAWVMIRGTNATEPPSPAVSVVEPTPAGGLSSTANASGDGKS